jgi:hypothetical protein
MESASPAQSQPAGTEQLHPALAALLSRRALLKSRFKIVEFLDMGGFATVFKCLDTKSGKEVRFSCSPGWVCRRDKVHPTHRVQTATGTLEPEKSRNKHTHAQ